MNNGDLGITKVALPQNYAITREKLVQLASRMLSALRFDSGAYLSFKDNSSATGQAVAALFLASLSYGIGFTLFTARLGLDSVEAGILLLLLHLILSLIAGLVWTITAFVIGTKLFQGKTQFSQLVRPLFFSFSPGVFFVLIAVPVDLVSSVVTAVVSIWIIVAGVVALKNAMGFGYDRSMLTYIVGFLIGIVIAGIFNI